MDRTSMQERFGIIGTSPGIRHVLDRVRQVAPTDITVLIEGESGVGKELVAKAVHELSSRRHNPMLTINCAAIPEGLLESELFGNEKGAYTGAVERRRGYFEESNGSSIFLDEIGEMPLSAQVRLLRVLETGEYSRVGSSTVLYSDVRVIAATNRNLGQDVASGRFREDLYYRLSTVIVTVPPLRDRKEDILPIFESFRHKFTQRYNRPMRTLDASAQSLLLRYRWPGNARELRNLAEQTAVLLRSETITADDIRPFLRGVSGSGSEAGLLPVRTTGQVSKDPESRERGLIYGALLELKKDVAELKDSVGQLIARPPPEWSAPHSAQHTSLRPSQLGPHLESGSDESASPSSFMLDDEDSFIEDVAYEIEQGNGENGEDLSVAAAGSAAAGSAASGQAASGSGAGLSSSEVEIPSLEDSERRLIEEALKRYNGNRRQTAEVLGISERTLYRKIKEYEKSDAAEEES